MSRTERGAARSRPHPLLQLNAIQFKDWAPQNLAIQCNFTYGSRGTSADAYVQVSLDGGSTWVDVAQCHFTTSSLRELYNLSALTAVISAYTATDGTRQHVKGRTARLEG